MTTATIDTSAKRHILSADQFDPDLLAMLFARADALRDWLGRGNLRRNVSAALREQILHLLFYAPSTRTYMSFAYAAHHMGMRVEGNESVQFSSVSKGESELDTFTTIAGYGPSVIVLRSKSVGDAARAAAISPCPVINAGDGSGEHPTQAVLDLYTLQKELGRLTELTIMMGGDLWNGRTVRSLAKLAAMYPGNRFIFAAPPTFGMQPDILGHLDSLGIHYQQVTDFRPYLSEVDAVYWTRVQAERLTADQQAYVGSLGLPDGEKPTFPEFTLGLADVRRMRPEARLLHPLPRVGEIHTDVDADPRAAYIRQMRNGMDVRMALIEYVLGHLD